MEGAEPSTFGKYLLVERLAEGGMAVVWRAKIVGPGGFEKEFCLKQIRSELAARKEFIDLFVAEAKLTVSLTHANIVPVYELGMVDGTYFLALELIDGPPLQRVIKTGAVPAPLAAYIVEQILRGLDYAHRRGVVHRDLSPSNVLVSRDGEVKIVDFGIAAPSDGRGVRGGSEGYMPPEQAAGERTDARADLYAVGVVLRELLSGKRGQTTLPDDVPAALRPIITRATSPAREDRYPDAAAMLSELSGYLRHLPSGPTQSELSSFLRRRLPREARRAGNRVDNHTGPRTAQVGRGTGPHTVPVGSATGQRAALDDKNQVVFATRIESDAVLADAAAQQRRGWVAAAAAAVLTALVAGGVIWARQAEPPGPQPTPPAPVPVRVTPPPPSQPASGHLYVHSTPPGAEVRLGDTVLGSTPWDGNVTLADKLRVQLRRRGYNPAERTLTPADFSGTPPQSTWSEKLQPAAKGALTLNVLPYANITIDGEKYGDRALKQAALTVGRHDVRLACPPTACPPSGREFRFNVAIEADKELRRVVDMRGEPHFTD